MQPCSQGWLADVPGGGGESFSKCGGASVNEEMVLLEGFSPVKTVKKSEGTEEIHTNRGRFTPRS